MFSIYLILEKRQEKKKQCQFCISLIFKQNRRLLQGASDNLVVEMQLDDSDKYFNYFRMSHETFEELLRLVGLYIEKQDTTLRTPIPSCKRSLCDILHLEIA